MTTRSTAATLMRATSPKPPVLWRWLLGLLLGALLLTLGACSGGSSDETDGDTAALQITTQPADSSVTDGATASFSVVTQGSGTLSYQWFKDGNAINGETRATLSFAAVYASDNGAQYTVQVSTGSVQVTSAAATLSVTPIALAIAAQPSDTSVQDGSDAVFAVSIGAGSEPVTYQWLRSGSAIDGATAATLTVASVTVADSGARFSVQIGNPAGNVTSAAATLTVSSTAVAPTIVTQPASVTVLAGLAASFDVVATSDGTLTYQWYRNGSAISGATASSYTAGTLAYSDGATFMVVVANAVGATSSNSATLTVNPRVTQVSAGGDHAAVRKEDGSVWSWGHSNATAGDALGGGPTTRSYGTMVKAQLSDGNAFTGVSTVAAGYLSSMAIKADGSVWAWGQNVEGEVGNGSTTDVDYPVQISDSAGTMLSGFAAASGGYNYTVALKSDSTVWAWGYALQGRLGNNNTGSAVRRYTTPVAVLDNTSVQLSSITQIDAGNDHSVALTSSGTVWVWGNGQAGRLGDGERNTVAYVAKPLLDSSGARISDVTQVSAGGDHSLLLKSNGTVYGWGVNSYGQLGGGNTTERDWAYLMTNGDGSTFGNVTAVQAGEDFSVLLRSDGTVWTVGRNQMGQLGNGSTVAYSATPVQVMLSDGSALSGVLQISVHDHTVIVLRSDATVWGWGSNAAGELGSAPTNTVQFHAYPKKIAVSGD
jgi:alpha-tubulin suppressor-like RCC1 family protein